MKVLIQAEAGSREKIRYDEKTLTPIGKGTASQPYPYPYGFIVGTTAADGDNADCYVVGNASLKAGTVVECDPVGLLEQVESGESDHKVLAVVKGEEAVIPDEALDMLRSFIYAVFTDIPGESVEVGAIQPVGAALQYLRDCKFD